MFVTGAGLHFAVARLRACLEGTQKKRGLSGGVLVRSRNFQVSTHASDRASRCSLEARSGLARVRGSLGRACGSFNCACGMARSIAIPSVRSAGRRHANPRRGSSRLSAESARFVHGLASAVEWNDWERGHTFEFGCFVSFLRNQGTIARWTGSESSAVFNRRCRIRIDWLADEYSRLHAACIAGAFDCGPLLAYSASANWRQMGSLVSLVPAFDQPRMVCAVAGNREYKSYSHSVALVALEAQSGNQCRAGGWSSDISADSCSPGWVLVTRAKNNQRQHWQVNKNYDPSPNLVETVRNVIPAPGSGAPAEQRCPGDFAARFRNEPEDKSIIKPALRHEPR